MHLTTKPNKADARCDGKSVTVQSSANLGLRYDACEFSFPKLKNMKGGVGFLQALLVSGWRYGRGTDSGKLIQRGSAF